MTRKTAQIRLRSSTRPRQMIVKTASHPKYWCNFLSSCFTAKLQTGYEIPNGPHHVRPVLVGATPARDVALGVFLLGVARAYHNARRHADEKAGQPDRSYSKAVPKVANGDDLRVHESSDNSLKHLVGHTSTNFIIYSHAKLWCYSSDSYAYPVLKLTMAAQICTQYTTL